MKNLKKLLAVAGIASGIVFHVIDKEHTRNEAYNEGYQSGNNTGYVLGSNDKAMTIKSRLTRAGFSNYDTAANIIDGISPQRKGSTMTDFEFMKEVEHSANLDAINAVYRGKAYLDFAFEDPSLEPNY
jgi:hypothetical protein